MNLEAMESELQQAEGHLANAREWLEQRKAGKSPTFMLSDALNETISACEAIREMQT